MAWFEDKWKDIKHMHTNKNPIQKIKAKKIFEGQIKYIPKVVAFFGQATVGKTTAINILVDLMDIKTNKHNAIYSSIYDVNNLGKPIISLDRNFLIYLEEANVDLYAIRDDYLSRYFMNTRAFIKKYAYLQEEKLYRNMKAQLSCEQDLLKAYFLNREACDTSHEFLFIDSVKSLFMAKWIQDRGGFVVEVKGGHQNDLDLIQSLYDYDPEIYPNKKVREDLIKFDYQIVNDSDYISLQDKLREFAKEYLI